MRERSLGITALAVLSITVGLVALFAGLALLLVGSWGAFEGVGVGVPMLVVGSLFVGLAVSAYLVGYGLWRMKHWSWAGGVVVFSVNAVASALAAAISGNPMAAIFPVIIAIAGIWYLQRPAVRAALLGSAETGSTDATKAPDVANAPEPAR